MKYKSDFKKYASDAIWWTILQLMQVTQPGGTIVTNASCAIWCPNLPLMARSGL